VAVVYTSATLSLAALEYFVNLEFATAPNDLVAVPAGIPDGVSRAEVEGSALPSNWRAYPAPDRLADLGSAWAASNRSAVLVVPSAVIPAERNYVLNPGHPEFRAIRVGTAEPFAFDPRMWKPD
jgi:RES domain-containing protein